MQLIAIRKNGAQIVDLNESWLTRKILQILIRTNTNANDNNAYQQVKLYH